MKNSTTLEKFISLKAKSLDERKQFVGKLLERVTKIEENIQRYQKDLQSEQEKSSQALGDSISLTHYTTLIFEKIERLERLRREAQAQLEAEQATLVELYADLRAHQKVLKKQSTAHEKAQAKKEQKRLDELSISKNYSQIV